jgi:hypothetical protein
MYHPSWPWMSHDLCRFGLSCMAIPVPSDAMGILFLKLNVPLRCSSVDRRGFSWDEHRRLSVVIASL